MQEIFLRLIAIIIYVSGCIVSYKVAVKMLLDLYPDKKWSRVDTFYCFIAVLCSWGGVGANAIHWPMFVHMKKELEHKGR